jgi:hypothetical protein
MMHWSDTSNPDGTVVDLFQFDLWFGGLSFKLYDQDQDDAKPWDNQADYYPRGVGEIVHHLNSRHHVLAAWNGLFFAYDRSKNPPNGLANHIGPVVVDGRFHNNFGTHRWFFGITKKRRFEVLYKPTRKQMDGKFLYGADGAQCLIRNGKPLEIAPYPDVGYGKPPTRFADSDTRVGSIPMVDHIRTSRISMGWTKDSRILYLLVVSESDTEAESARRLRAHEPLGSGWNLFDLQAFWKSLGVYGAINSDGGVVTQYAAFRKDGLYTLMPARIASPHRKLTFGPDFKGSPDGGTLLTFYVSDSKWPPPRSVWSRNLE